jgi:hypothetical protein
MTLVFLAVLGAGVVGFVLYPVFLRETSSPDAPITEQAAELDRLAEEKARVLASIKDLDFEYKSGKLSEADYKRVRGEELARAAQIMTRMENLTAGDKTVPDNVRKEETGPICPSCQQANPEGSKFCLRCGNRFETPAKCPNCGTDLPAEARFCISCGEAIPT